MKLKSDLLSRLSIAERLITDKSIDCSLMVPLDYPYTLKFFNRGSIDFSQLADRICIRIIEKHPSGIQLRLNEASHRTSQLVEDVLCQIEIFRKLQDAVELFNMHKIITNDSLYRDWNPPEAGQTFREWAMEYIMHVDLSVLTIFDSIFAQEVYEVAMASHRQKFRFISLLDICIQQGRLYGPSEFNLGKVPACILYKVVLKTSLVSLSRLALTSKLGKYAVDLGFNGNAMLNLLERSKPFICAVMLGYDMCSELSVMDMAVRTASRGWKPSEIQEPGEISTGYPRIINKLNETRHEERLRKKAKAHKLLGCIYFKSPYRTVYLLDGMTE